MKKLSLLTITAFLFAITTNAQKLNTDTLPAAKSYEYYTKKRDTYNTVGWICVGTGLTMAGVGLLTDVGSAYNHGSGKKGDGIAVAGEVVALAGIPFFIIAHSEKKKASLYLKRICNYK